MRKTFAALAGITFGLFVAGVAIAARNSTGTYSLVAGNPVVTGTTITSTWANNTLTDLQTEMTDSLSRSGKGGMLAPLKIVDGTVAAPAYSFTSEPGSGLYRIGASNPAISVSGVKRQEWTATGTAVNGNATVSGTLESTGAATLASLGVTGGATVGGTLEVTGATTVPTPTAAGHAATKEYADGTACTFTVAAGDEFRAGANNYVRRFGNKAVLFYLKLWRHSGSSTTVGTLSAGCWPVEIAYYQGITYSDGLSPALRIGTDGVITAQAANGEFGLWPTDAPIYFSGVFPLP